MATRRSRRSESAAAELSGETAAAPRGMSIGRLAAHVAMAVLLLMAAWVRLAGSYWGDQGMHPDERGIYLRIQNMRVVLHDEEQRYVPGETRALSPLGELFRLVDVNLRAGARHARIPEDQEDLNPEHFAYGSLFYMSSLAASSVVAAVRADQSSWWGVGMALGVLGMILPFAPVLAQRARRSLPEVVRRALPRVSWIVGGAGVLFLLLVQGARIAHTAGPPHPDVFGYGGAWFVARPLSALCGVLTILVLYRIGCRFFDAGTGLLAAAFLSFTVLHVQLSHYYASDTMLALFAALAVLYCAHVATRSRFADFLWAGLFIGAAIATKFSAVLLPPLYVLAFVLSWYALPRERIADRLVAFVAGGAVATLALLWMQPFAWVETTLPTRAMHGQAFSFISFGTATIALLALCALAAAFRVATRGKGIAWAVAILLPVLIASVSVIGWVLLGLTAAAIVIRLWFSRGDDAPRPRLTWVALAAAVLVSAVAVPVTSQAMRDARGMPALFGPAALPIGFSAEYPFVGSNQFRHDTKEQSTMAQGKAFVWTFQYEHTPPVVYQIRNLVQLSMGAPLALLCLVGLAWFVARSVTTWHRPSLIITAWVLANALVIGTFQTKFARYMAPYLPFLCFMGAAFVAHFVWRSEQGRMRRRVIVGLAGAVAVGWSALYSWSFVKTVYLEPNTRIRASRWIYTNIPSGTTIVGEHWDDLLPHPIEGRSPEEYPKPPLPMYDDDFPRLGEDEWDTANPNGGKYGFIADSLERGEYLVLASRKLYGAVMRQENKRFRLASQFYKLLFSGRLGFTHVATFTNPPRVLGVPIDEDLGEESFTIYDHPKICIFKKTRALDRDAYYRLLTTPATADVAAVTMEDVMRAEAGRPLWQPRLRLASVRYWLVLELLTLLAIPYVFRAGSRLADRGLLLAKPIGVLAAAYGAWLVSASGLMAYGPASMIVVLVLLAAGALVITVRHRAALGAQLRASWPALLGAEVAFTAVFGLFLYVRRMNPAIRWSEKYMDFSFLSAAYRTDFFPLKDPWVSGFDVNYYYWGQVLYATLGRLASVPPAFAYNLACAAAPALAFAAALAVGKALTQRFRYGLLAGFLAVFAGNLIGYLQIARNLDVGGFNREHSLTAGRYVSSAPRVAGAAWNTLKGLDDGVVARVPFPRVTVGFDNYFWPTGHYVDRNPKSFSDLIKGVVANEFPMWTYLHADLHAHMIVMAFTLTFIGLLASLVLGQGDGRRLFGDGTSWPMGVALLALTFGAVSCINTWDVPTCALLLLGTLALKAYAHRRAPVGARRTVVERLDALGVRGTRLLRLHLLARVLAVEVVLPLLAVGGLAYLAYWPFHTYFVPRATQVRLTDMNFTPIDSFLKIFGLFALVVVPFLLLALVRWAVTSRRAGRLAAAVGGMAIAIGAVSYPSWSQGDVGDLVRAAWWSLPLQREMTAAAAFRPRWGLLIVLAPLIVVNGLLLLRRGWSPSVRFALLLTAAALSIVGGCEVVYMFETWGGENQRWNTPFKFYLHAWLLFALAVPVLWRTVWTARLEGRLALPARVGRLVWSGAFVALLAASAVFPIFGAYAVIWGDGARCAIGPRPTLDGLAYLDAEDGGRLFAGDRDAIAWFNRNVRGNGAVVMEAAPGYYNELGRWGAFTGMPSVLGWDHHIGERGHVPEKYPRMADVQLFYQSPDRQQCLNILRKYGVDYVVVGELERSRWLHGGQPFLTNTGKFRQWGDVLETVYDSSSVESGGVQIYRVRRDPLS